MLFLAAILTIFASLGVLLAQDETPPLHQFFESAAVGSEAILDGQLVPDGEIIRAFNEDGQLIGEAAIADGTWLIQVDPSDAQSVTFTVGNSFPSAPLTVVAGQLTELPLTLSSIPDGFAVSPDGSFDILADVGADFPTSSATLLRDGTVLYPGEASAAIFDPATGNTTTLDPPSQLRGGHVATLLQDGTVLLTGGFATDPADGAFTTFADAVLYDPETTSFQVLGEMTEPRTRHTATLLNDGRVVIVGGVAIEGGGADRVNQLLSSVEIFDASVTGPASAQLRSAEFSPAGPTNIAHSNHEAVLQDDGTIVVIGGLDADGRLESQIEILDPETGESRSGGSIAGSLGFPVRAFALPGGDLLLAGGTGVERYDPESGFSSTIVAEADLPFPGIAGDAVLLQDGRVLLIGGAAFTGPNDGEIFARTAFVDIETAEVTIGPEMAQGRLNFLLVTPLLDGSVLVAGGSTGPNVSATTRATTIERFTGPPAILPQFPEPKTQELALGPGFNLSGWLGATPVAEATESIAGQFNSIFRWDAAAQRFASFQTSGPAFLNDLTELTLGDAVWIFINDPAGAAWEQPAFNDARDVDLLAGFNLVLWTGPDGTPVEQAFAALGADLVGAFIWDQPAQSFLSFAPDAPSFINTADVLNFGEGLWVQMSAPATWSQPAASP